MRKIASPFTDSLPPSGNYSLREVAIDISDFAAIIFKAKLLGPANSPVWARAWVSNQADGTLAEAASGQLTAGDEVALTVRLVNEKEPSHAHIRIESAPLRTEHVMSAELF